MRVLVVAAHPDDIEIGCGGFIAANTEVGNEVKAIILTNGERGCPGLSVTEAAQIRTEEAYAASKILGYEIVEMYGLPDGMLAYSNGLRDKLARNIEILAPDIVLVTHERESHPDHKVAGILVREALKTWLNKPPECLTYEVWTPLEKTDRVFNISYHVEKKLQAIRAHNSQISRQAFDEASVGLSRYRGVMQGRCEYAEGFGRMRLHGGSGVKIALVLLTYAPTVDNPRAVYARKTLESVLENVSVGEFNQLHVHIADDGSDPQHVRELVEIAKRFGYDDVSITNSERRGYGGSYNLATQALHGDYDIMFPVEDDWQLLRPLNLEPLANAIENSNGELRCIRLGYLGFTSELRGKLIYHANQMFLLFDPNSPEHHVFAGHPRLETVAYEREVGPWNENTRAGDVEWDVTHRWPARVGVAWPLDMAIPAGQVAGNLFGHIGTVQTNSLEGAIA